jgi:membrane protease subunit HflC
VANELRSTGAAEGEQIRADADRQREVTIANAYRDAQKSRAKAMPRRRACMARPSARTRSSPSSTAAWTPTRPAFAQEGRRAGDRPGVVDFFKNMRGARRPRR